ncbi:hypothetical protein F4553_001113 [Allocatelliglobosispora scoriae]|uniref:WD40 repeat domain-containing protein n=1 Tax=Allocatelliglobosispora scoriae TaxID=643052 RepID=A0A841BHG9_9ACTN|nr:PD40 domain-containing protein [Allocatelliglobosispora scoriae]MBB5867734.1 hypothetical protein [Allocatelliglobosispora scoriae]
MTGRLGDVFAEIGAAAPGVRISDDLWRRGRRRRRRRIGAAAASLILLAALVWLPFQRREPHQPAGDGKPVLPTAVANPHLWQTRFADSANGPAKLVFFSDNSLNLEPVAVVVGRDDSYRLIYKNPGEELGYLSPDGRYLLRRSLLDLSTGQTRELSRPLPFGRWVWSADNRFALVVYDNDDDVISYGPNNEQINNPAKPDDIGLLDVATGEVRILRTEDADQWRGSISPDGTRVAVTVGRETGPQRILILNTATGAIERALQLTDQQMLAGDAAWSPDGKSLVLLRIEQGCLWWLCGEGEAAAVRWHLQFFDPATGAVTDERTTGRTGLPEELLGWRDGAPVLVINTPEVEDCRIVEVAGAELRRLPLDTDGRGCPIIPRDLLEHAALGGPAIKPSFLSPVMLMPPMLMVLLTVGVVIRRRRWPTADPPPPAGHTEAD